MIKYLLENNNSEIDDEKIKSFLNKSLKKKADLILDSIKKSHIEDDQVFKMNVIYNHLDNINELIKITEAELKSRASKYQAFVDLACELPGIDTFSAI